MSYRVDSKTMLFTDLSDAETLKLQEQVEDLVLRGTSIYDTEAYQSWVKVCNESHNPNFGLLMTTVYAQRALLSIVRRQQPFVISPSGDWNAPYKGR